MSKKTMQFVYYMLLAAGVVVVDQITKLLTVLYIPLEESIPFLPGILQLSYVQNDGAAFSSFSGRQGMFLLIFLVFTGLMLLEYFKKPMGFLPFERWCIAAIYGGGLANMVDRLRMGYVVDMFETVFMEFPVFNVADIFISVGSVLIFLHLVLFNKKFWKDDKKKMTLFADIPGERLDAFLARSLPELSRSAAQRLIEEGAVKRNGGKAKKNDKLNEGDRIDYEIPEAKPVDIAPTEMALDIVYEDEDLLVINKPKGLVVHPAPGHSDDTLVNGLLFAMGDDLSGINGELRPGIVHRIDKDTSGLLAVAKNDYAHAMLASQLKDHSMARTYEAIVVGNLKEDSGTVDAPIGRHPTDRKKMCVTQRNSRNAVTHWEVIQRFRGYTHIRCRLETGRTHQIRVHMAYIGHPILGDMVYGRKKPELGQDSQCLHAGQLCFQHPRDGRPVMVFAELPKYFQDVLEKLKKMG